MSQVDLVGDLRHLPTRYDRLFGVRPPVMHGEGNPVSCSHVGYLVAYANDDACSLSSWHEWRGTRVRAGAMMSVEKVDAGIRDLDVNVTGAEIGQIERSHLENVRPSWFGHDDCSHMVPLGLSIDGSN